MFADTDNNFIVKSVLNNVATFRPSIITVSNGDKPCGCRKSTIK